MQSTFSTVLRCGGGGGSVWLHLYHHACRWMHDYRGSSILARAIVVWQAARFAQQVLTLALTMLLSWLRQLAGRTIHVRHDISDKDGRTADKMQAPPAKRQADGMGGMGGMGGQMNGYGGMGSMGGGGFGAYVGAVGAALGVACMCRQAVLLSEMLLAC